MAYNSFAQLLKWQYWLHLIIIDVALMFVIGALMFFVKGWNVLLIYLITFLVTLVVLVIVDPVAHFLMGLLGWKD